jgi:hypothetical protein
LCDFFAGSLGLTYDQIMGWHEEGSGFGVIAQALWMAEMTGMDPEDILAVKGGDMDYSELGLPEGVDNWGRLRGYVFGKGAEKTVHNLGEIMSGRRPTGNRDLQNRDRRTDANPLSPAVNDDHAAGLRATGRVVSTARARVSGREQVSQQSRCNRQPDSLEPGCLHSATQQKPNPRSRPDPMVRRDFPLCA